MEGWECLWNQTAINPDAFKGFVRTFYGRCHALLNAARMPLR